LTLGKNIIGVKINVFRWCRFVHKRHRWRQQRRLCLSGLDSSRYRYALEFSIDFAEKFSDDAIVSSDDAGSTSSAGFALVVPLTLASSSGFLSIFFVGLVNVAMVDLAKKCFRFVSLFK
jgi:hypothetical protein